MVHNQSFMPIDTFKMLQIGPLKHSWMQHRQRKCLSIEKTGQSNKKSLPLLMMSATTTILIVSITHRVETRLVFQHLQMKSKVFLLHGWKRKKKNLLFPFKSALPL